MKPQILVICAHLHGNRVKRRDKSQAQPMAGLQIVSQIDRNKYDVDLYHEMWHGQYDTSNPGQYELVFISGIQKDFDRMKQLSYFFRRTGALTIAGGSICTIFPDYAKQFFDAVCVGGIDAVAAVMRDYERKALDRVYHTVSTDISDIRMDYQILNESQIHLKLHLVESSRGCNFKCDFCSIPAENAKHAIYGLDAVKRAIDTAIANSPKASLRKLFPIVYFIDNNFSNNPRYTEEVIAYLKSDKRIRMWGALITQNTLNNRPLVKRMAESGCVFLFSGIESFDLKFLTNHKKKQNVVHSKSIIDDIRYAQSLGIIINYGYLFDARMTSVEDMKDQLHTITISNELSIPVFMSMVSPLLGTKLFWNSAAKNELIPNLRIRDLDGQSLAYRNHVSSKAEISAFAKQMWCDPTSLFDKKMVRRKIWRYIRTSGFKPLSWYAFYQSNYKAFLNATGHRKGSSRNYIGGEDVLDPVYQEFPKDISDSDKQKYFAPSMITDEHGAVQPWLKKYEPEAKSSGKRGALSMESN